MGINEWNLDRAKVYRAALIEDEYGEFVVIDVGYSDKVLTINENGYFGSGSKAWLRKRCRQVTDDDRIEIFKKNVGSLDLIFCNMSSVLGDDDK